MKKNWLGLLSVLSLLGLWGFTKEHNGLLGFLGFAYYFRYFFVTPDEMFIKYVQRAASAGFFSGIIATAFMILLRILFPAYIQSKMVLVSCYFVSIIVFNIVLSIFEFKETEES